MIIAQEIPGRSGYLVDTQGTVFKRDGNTLKQLPSSSNGKGYLRASFGDGYEYIHRLVLTTFSGAPLVGQQARHLDGTRDNNYLVNLRWGTRAENEADKLQHGTHQSQLHTHEALTDERAQHVLASDTPTTEIANELGVSHAVISRIRQGQTYTHLPRDKAVIARRGSSGRKGEANSLHKITEAMAREIINSTETGYALSKRLPLSMSQIYRIKNGERWAYLQKPGE